MLLLVLIFGMSDVNVVDVKLLKVIFLFCSRSDFISWFLKMWVVLFGDSVVLFLLGVVCVEDVNVRLFVYFEVGFCMRVRRFVSRKEMLT